MKQSKKDVRVKILFKHIKFLFPSGADKEKIIDAAGQDGFNDLVEFGYIVQRLSGRYGYGMSVDQAKTLSWAGANSIGNAGANIPHHGIGKVTSTLCGDYVSNYFMSGR